MEILSQYLLKRLLVSFLATLGIVSLAITIAELMLNFNEILSETDHLGGVVQYIAFRVVGSYFRFLIPLSAFISVFLTLGLLARSNELIAMKAGGISPLRAALPLLVAAAGLALFTLAFNETIEVQCARWMAEFEGEGGGERGMEFRAGSFWYQKGHTIYNLGEADSENRTLRDVTIYERTEQGRLQRLIQAEEAWVEAEDERWTLRNASVRTFDVFDPTAPIQMAFFDGMTLEIPDDPGLALLTARLRTLSISDLRAHIKESKRRGGEAPRSQAFIQLRLVRPLSIFLFALLAVPLSLRVEETKSLATPALQGVVLVAIYWFLENIAEDLTSRGAIQSGILPWLLILTFAAIGAWRIRVAPR